MSMSAHHKATRAGERFFFDSLKGRAVRDLKFPSRKRRGREQREGEPNDGSRSRNGAKNVKKDSLEEK